VTLFTSTREKRLWLYVILVLAAITSTLVFGQPLVGLFGNHNIQAAFFLLGMILVGATILVYSLKTRTGKTEIVIWLGLAAVYTMFFLRLGLAERSHLIEYSVLAIFIHSALVERANKGNHVLKPALFALFATIIIGVLDECIQLFLPTRVFDPLDILFNGLAGLMAIGSVMVLKWARKKMKRTN
jgi:uncharacterized membrane protein